MEDVKAPTDLMKNTKKRPAADRTGVQFTAARNPFISSWPASRPALNMKERPSQTVTEAASWCKEAWESPKKEGVQ